MEFGKLLKNCIKKQNLTIYHLAKETGIDRSFLQGVLKGTRKLPKKRFSDIVNSKYFTASQIHQLCEKYFLERFGKDKIERFDYIEKCLKNKIKEDLNSELFLNEVDLHDGTSFHSGKKEILNVIYSIMNRSEINQFISNFDFLNTEVNSIVYKCCKDKKIKNFFHYTTFDKFSSIRNISIVFNSIHYAEIGYITFNHDKLAVTSLMPYYIIADNYFIMYDREVENAVMLNTGFMSNYLKAKISEVKKECTKSVYITENPFDYMELIRTITIKPEQSEVIGFDTGVCPTFITPEIIQSIATPYIKNIPSVTQQLFSHYEAITGIVGDTPSIHSLIVTYDGIDNFVKNGYLSGFPKLLAKPVPVETRSYFLESMLQKEKLGNIVITNPNMFKTNFNLNYQINNNHLIFSASDGTDEPSNYNGKITFCNDVEYITNDFRDYFSYMEMSEKTYSKQVSEEIICNFIRQLEIQQ